MRWGSTQTSHEMPGWIHTTRLDANGQTGRRGFGEIAKLDDGLAKCPNGDEVGEMAVWPNGQKRDGGTVGQRAFSKRDVGRFGEMAKWPNWTRNGRLVVPARLRTAKLRVRRPKVESPQAPIRFQRGKSAGRKTPLREACRLKSSSENQQAGSPCAAWVREDLGSRWRCCQGKPEAVSHHVKAR